MFWWPVSVHFVERNFFQALWKGFSGEDLCLCVGASVPAWWGVAVLTIRGPDSSVSAALSPAFSKGYKGSQ